MATCVYSVKGGAGATTFVALAAQVGSANAPTIAVDLAGDLPAALGVQPARPEGVFDWLSSLDDPRDEFSPDVLSIATTVSPTLQLVAVGAIETWSAGANGRSPAQYVDTAIRLLASLDKTGSHIFIDAGTLPVADGPPSTWSSADHLRYSTVEQATNRWLVTRGCYLGLLAASRAPIGPNEVVLISETGRALGPADVEGALGVPVRMEIRADAAVARTIDAGLVSSRIPHGLRRLIARTVCHV